MDPNVNQTENQNQFQTPSTIKTKPISPTYVSKSSKLKWFIIGFLGILALTIVGVGGYYLGVNKKSNLPPAELAPTPMITPKLTLEPTVISSIPSTWTVKKSELCKVNMPLPPKTAPYYIPSDENLSPSLDNGGYWTFEESSSGGEMFDNSVISIFRNPDLGGSEYVAGGVFVSCTPNTNNLTSEEVADQYVDKYITNSDALTVKQRSAVKIWGQDAVALIIEGGMQLNNNQPTYYIATKDMIYQISKASMSTNQTIKDATQIIFDNLSFTQ